MYIYCSAYIPLSSSVSSRSPFRPLRRVFATPAAAQLAAGYALYARWGVCARRENGALARQILDSLERQHPFRRDMPRFRDTKIVAARAFVASRDLNPRRALLYLHSIADTDELRNDPETDLFITALMCNEYQVLNRHDEMLRSMLLYLDKARKYKTGYAKRSLCYTWGYVQSGRST
ncbi:MAG: hypothetical protein ACLR8Y_17795 [Alistipes indistinctus]